MFLTTHVAVGILISQRVDSPFWVFFLSLISHFFMDFIPHGDEELGNWLQQKNKRWIIFGITDMVFTAGFVIFLYHTRALPRMGLVSASLVGSILPDFLAGFLPIIHKKFDFLSVVRLFNRLGEKTKFNSFINKHKKFHTNIHTLIKFQLKPYQGYLMQVCIIFFCIFLSLHFL